MSAINILSNCHFDLSKIKSILIGSRLTSGESITYPIEYITVSGSSDSIIKIENFDSTNDTITIGGQLIQLNKIINFGDNITFNEELIINQNGKNYEKTISFTIPQLTTFLINQIKEFVITSDGLVGLAPTIALLIDENEQNLIVGYDRPLYLSTTDLTLGEGNEITLSYKSLSQSRSRSWSI